MKLTHALLLSASLPMIAACEDGRITLSVTDAPVDEAVEVIVQFSRVAFERDDGTREVVVLEAPRRIDLRTLSGGRSEALLAERSLAAGTYRAVEFTIDGNASSLDSSVLLTDGARLPLFVPNASRAGLRVLADFEIVEQEHTKATVDFDLRRSLFIVDGTTAELRPQLRFVLDDRAGTVRGAVAPSLVAAACSPAVYVYTGADVEPDDVGGNGTQPVASAIVDAAQVTGEFNYAAGFLEAGAYTLALTCEADRDQPGRNDDIAFKRRQNVTVRERRTVTADFQ